jgi:hypothetical protein
MSQNLITLNLSDSAFNEIDAALTTLEQHFAGFLKLSPEERKSMLKMGDKTEAFCRQTLMVAEQNTQHLPASLMMGEAQTDLRSLDQLRPRLHRLRELLGKGDDTEMALGSDIYAFCLGAYASLKVTGKGASLEVLRQAMSVRFNRGSKAKTEPTVAPNG